MKTRNKIPKNRGYHHERYRTVQDCVKHHDMTPEFAYELIKTIEDIKAGRAKTVAVDFEKDFGLTEEDCEFLAANLTTEEEWDAESFDYVKHECLREDQEPNEALKAAAKRYNEFRGSQLEEFLDDQGILEETTLKTRERLKAEKFPKHGAGLVNSNKHK